MMEPSVGRIVLYHPHADDGGDVNGQPHAAIVAHVHTPRLINLTVFNENGSVYAKTSVALLQDDDAAPAEGNFAEWMAYQKGQAGKTDAMGDELLKAVSNLQADVDSKFQEIGAWLTPALSEMRSQIAALSTPAKPEPPLTPPPPQEAAAADIGGAGAAPQAQPGAEGGLVASATTEAQA